MDFFFERKPFEKHATELINLCAEKQLLGFTTPVIISNVYYLLRKGANHHKVVEKIKQLLSIIEIINISKQAVNDALNYDFKDFEDALQNYTAIDHNEIKVIITRNLKDF